jgi:hypothetical protein
MAAAVEIDESNGIVETVTHGIATCYLGSADTPQMAYGSNPVALSGNSYEKWLRVHLTDLAGSISLSEIKVSLTGALPVGAVLYYNGHTVPATYDATKKTTFSQPATSSTRTPNSIPTSPPATANLGIGGSLLGSLTVVGWSDYLLLQMRLTGALSSGVTGDLVLEYSETL